MGVNQPPSLENLPFCMAKTVVQCTSAGQFTAPRAISFSCGMHVIKLFLYAKEKMLGILLPKCRQ